MPSRTQSSKRVSKLSRRQLTWLAEQHKGLDQLRKQLKADLANATQQIEAYLNLHSVLNSGFELPPMHGWPVSPDLALLLVRQVQHNHYDLIVEFGSGTSTVLIAQTLLKKKPQALCSTRFVAFEHLPPYFEQTQAQLEQRGLASMVSLTLAPLGPYVAADGAAYPYYSCHDTLAGFASAAPVGSRVLVLVDGPPAATGKHARWPAFEVITSQFAGVQIDFLLDDYIREDEKQIATSWEKLAHLKDWPFSATRYRLEKDAYLMQLHIPAITSASNN